MLKTILLSLVISQVIVLALFTFVTVSFPYDMFTEAWTNTERMLYLIESAGAWLSTTLIITGMKGR